MKYDIEYDDETGWTLCAEETALFHVGTREELEDLQRLISEIVWDEDA